MRLCFDIVTQGRVPKAADLSAQDLELTRDLRGGSWTADKLRRRLVTHFKDNWPHWQAYIADKFRRGLLDDVQCEDEDDAGEIGEDGDDAEAGIGKRFWDRCVVGMIA
jgi:hypothetical protein